MKHSSLGGAKTKCTCLLKAGFFRHGLLWPWVLNNTMSYKCNGIKCKPWITLLELFNCLIILIHFFFKIKTFKNEQLCQYSWSTINTVSWWALKHYLWQWGALKSKQLRTLIIMDLKKSLKNALSLACLVESVQQWIYINHRTSNFSFFISTPVLFPLHLNWCIDVHFKNFWIKMSDSLTHS